MHGMLSITLSEKTAIEKHRAVQMLDPAETCLYNRFFPILTSEIFRYGSISSPVLRFRARPSKSTVGQRSLHLFTTVFLQWNSPGPRDYGEPCKGATLVEGIPQQEPLMR
jgi:hypothetical protein